jgi:hypothetical protein
MEIKIFKISWDQNGEKDWANYDLVMTYAIDEVQSIDITNSFCTICFKNPTMDTKQFNLSEFEVEIK